MKILVYLIFLLTVNIKSAELKYDVYGYYDFLKFFKVIFLFDNKVAANIGREAFLEPEIFTVPLSLFAPKTSSFCMIIL